MRQIPDTPWPAQRVVASMPGSLPMGGVVHETPVHAFESTPSCLALGPQPSLQPRRHDIDLGGYLAFFIDDVVTAAEADCIVAASEHFGYREEAPGISTPPGMRMNKSVHWVADEALLGPMMQRIQPLLPPAIGARPCTAGSAIASICTATTTTTSSTGISMATGLATAWTRAADGCRNGPACVRA